MDGAALRTDAAAPAEAPAGPALTTLPPAGPRWLAFGGRGFKAALLLAVLIVHFLSRQHLIAAMPLAEQANYPFVYRTSLALLAGHGFSIYRISDAPESKPVAEFLNCQRNGLSREEFRRFLDGPDGRPAAFPIPEAETPLPLVGGGELKTPNSPLHTMRVLDLYTTALLWRVFGIRWSVLLTFCAACSTGVCLLIFFMARRLGGGFWPGLCAAVLYLASPLENDFAIRSLRNISPLWFAVLAFAAMVCLVERFRSTPLNWAALGLTGLLTTLGCGWRQDALVLPGILAASVAGLLFLRRRGWRYFLAGGSAFAAGAYLPLLAIQVLCPSPRVSPLVSFHMSYYGEYTRCNLLGLEDTLQVSRDDAQTDMTAQQYHADHDPPSGPVVYCSPAYGSACYRMYREEIPQNLYHWTAAFPGFFVRALDACRLKDLPVGGSWYPPTVPRPRWLKPVAAWVLNPLAAAGGWLFALGVGVSLIRPGVRWYTLCLVGFSVLYAVVLFIVLPEVKHAAPLILPLSVFGGIGLASLATLARPFGLPAKARATLRPAAYLAAGGASVAFVWVLACGGAYWYSRECRRELLDAVRAKAAAGAPAPETLRAPQVFSVTLRPETGARPAGYLLRIAAGSGESFLECRHLHHDHPLIPARLLFTRHRIQPGREQCFFVTCHPGTAFGDVRPYVCTVLLHGDSRFLSCTRVDLSDWLRLPLSTVFTPGEISPGNPVVGGATAVSLYEERSDLNFLGLSGEELIRYGMASPVALFPPGDGAGSEPRQSLPPADWRPVAGFAEVETAPTGLRVQTHEIPGTYAAQTAPMTAPADATYLFRLRYRPEVGGLMLGAVAEFGGPWLALSTAADPPGATATRILRVHLHAGQTFFLVAANGGVTPGKKSVFVLEELSGYREESPE